MAHSLAWGLRRPPENQYVYSRASVDLAQPLVFETVMSAKTVGRTKRLVTLSTWVLLQYLKCKRENALRYLKQMQLWNVLCVPSRKTM